MTLPLANESGHNEVARVFKQNGRKLLAQFVFLVKGQEGKDDFAKEKVFPTQ